MSDSLKNYTILLVNGTKVRIAADSFTESGGAVKFMRNREVIGIFLASGSFGFYEENAQLSDPPVA